MTFIDLFSVKTRHCILPKCLHHACPLVKTEGNGRGKGGPDKEQTRLGVSRWPLAWRRFANKTQRFLQSDNLVAPVTDEIPERSL
eukprot:s462_g49.t1